MNRKLYNIKPFDIDEVIDSVINGQYTQAKEQIKDKCSRYPERMAYRLVLVYARLRNMEHAKAARRIVTMFNKEDHYEDRNLWIQ